MLDAGRGLAALIRHRKRWARQAAAAHAAGGPPAPRGALREVTGFGSNPGRLRMFVHLPAGLPRGAPLVVALHGCTQDAAGYDQGSGWSAMADAHGFALLLPEQRQANNPNRCFNWFDPAHASREGGEAVSIRQMIGHLATAEGLGSVFVTGLSAGGAMASALLATHPEIFAGGAVIAGLPHGAAGTVGEAFGAMFTPQVLSAGQRGAAVRAASPHGGPWPRVAVWHGTGDTTVRPGNAEEVAKQWLEMHRLAGAPPSEAGSEDGHAWRRWRDAQGAVVVEVHLIDGMAHGVPLHAGSGDGQCGVAGPFLLDVGHSSTHGILEFWGIASPSPGRARPARAEAGPAAESLLPDPGAVIRKALAAAGLMRR